MKNNLLSFFTVLIIGTSFAQDVHIVYENDETTLLNGTEIVMTGDPSDLQVKALLKIKNVAGYSENYYVQRKRILYGSPTDLLCNEFSCMDGQDVDFYNYPAPFELDDQESNLFQPGFFPNNESFCAINKYYIVDGASRLVDSISVKFVVGLSECYLSTKELSTVKEFKIFPNPSSGQVTIKDAQEGSMFEVYDMLGKVTYKGTVNSASQIVDLSSLTDGVYFYAIRQTNGQLLPARKLVIRK